MSDSENSQLSLSDDPYYADDFETETDDEELLRSLVTEPELKTDAKLSPQSLKNICTFVRNHASIIPRSNTDAVPYNSSSDENDVVVGVAVAEINAKPKEVRKATPAAIKPTSPSKVIKQAALGEGEKLIEQPKTVSTEKIMKKTMPKKQSSIKSKYKQSKNLLTETKSIESAEDKQVCNSTKLVQFPHGQYMRIPEKYVAYWEAAAKEISYFEKYNSNAGNIQEISKRPHSTATCCSFSPTKISSTRQHRNSCPASISTMSFRSRSDRTAHSIEQEILPQDFELEIDAETDTEGPFDVRFSSTTPEGFNPRDHVGEVKLIRRSNANNPRRSNRKSWSFSNERVREIDRQNAILLKKILSQKPPPKTHACSVCTPKVKPSTLPHIDCLPVTQRTSAAVNRMKQQRQIDHDNQLLQRKIAAIYKRKPTCWEL